MDGFFLSLFPGHGCVSGILAVRERSVQGGGFHWLLQHVHQHFHLDSDEHGQVRGCLPPCQSAGHEDPSQSQGKSVSFPNFSIHYSKAFTLSYSVWNVLRHHATCQHSPSCWETWHWQEIYVVANSLELCFWTVVNEGCKTVQCTNCRVTSDLQCQRTHWVDPTLHDRMWMQLYLSITFNLMKKHSALWWLALMKICQNKT